MTPIEENNGLEDWTRLNFALSVVLSDAVQLASWFSRNSHSHDLLTAQVEKLQNEWQPSVHQEVQGTSCKHQPAPWWSFDHSPKFDVDLENLKHARERPDQFALQHLYQNGFSFQRLRQAEETDHCVDLRHALEARHSNWWDLLWQVQQKDWKSLRLFEGHHSDKERNPVRFVLSCVWMQMHLAVCPRPGWRMYPNVLGCKKFDGCCQSLQRVGCLRHWMGQVEFPWPRWILEWEIGRKWRWKCLICPVSRWHLTNHHAWRHYEWRHAELKNHKTVHCYKRIRHDSNFYSYRHYKWRSTELKFKLNATLLLLNF